MQCILFINKKLSTKTDSVKTTILETLENDFFLLQLRFSIVHSKSLQMLEFLQEKVHSNNPNDN